MRTTALRHPSPWLDDVATTTDIGRIELASFADAVRRSPFPATSSEQRLRAALHGAIDDPVLDRATTAYASRKEPRLTAYDGDLAGATLRAPFERDAVVSATSLESWVSCPHAYFAQHILRINSAENPELEVQLTPLDRGLLVHTVLDEVVRWTLDGTIRPATPGSGWLAEHRGALLESFAAQAQALEDAGLVGRPTMWALERPKLLHDLMSWFDKDSELLQARRAVPVASEYRFGFDADSSPAARVDLGGRSLRFRGSIDRIDRSVSGEVFLADYKTGKSTKFKGISNDDPTLHGSFLQLGVYAVVAARDFGISERVRAEYTFLSRPFVGQRISIDFDADTHRKVVDVLDVIARQISAGLFPAMPSGDPFVPFVTCHYCDPDGLGTVDLFRRQQAKLADPRLADYLALIDPQYGTADANDDVPVVGALP